MKSPRIAIVAVAAAGLVGVTVAALVNVHMLQSVRAASASNLSASDPPQGQTSDKSTNTIVDSASNLSLPALQPADFNQFSCIGYGFEYISASQKQSCANRKDLDFTSVLGPSDLNAISEPKGNPLWGGKEFSKYYECRSAGVSASGIEEAFFFAAALVKKFNTSVARETCSIVVQSTRAGIRSFGANVLQFFHSTAEQKTCFETMLCPGVQVHMSAVGANDGIDPTIKYIYMLVLNSSKGNQLAVSTLDICAVSGTNKLRPCNYH